MITLTYECQLFKHSASQNPRKLRKVFFHNRLEQH